MSTFAMLTVESPNRVSKAITVGTMRPVNHAAVEYVDDGLIFEALFGGIEVTKSDRWYASRSPKTRVHKSIHEVPYDKYTESLGLAWKHEKDRYDFKNLTVSLPLIRLVAKRFVKDEDLNWICSEYAEFLARAAGVNFISRWTKCVDVSPGDLFDSIRYEMGSYTELRY